MEMGLDAFQFARPGVGWPADLGSSSSAVFLQAAQNANYLTPDEVKSLHSVRIANVSDNDLLNTRLLEWKRSDVSLVVVRKDGTSSEFSSASDADAFAPLPARDPVWLP